MSYDDTRGGKFKIHPVTEGVPLLDQVAGGLGIFEQVQAVIVDRAKVQERVVKRVVGSPENAPNFQSVRWTQTHDVEAILTARGALRALVVFAPHSSEVLHELYYLPDGGEE